MYLAKRSSDLFPTMFNDLFENWDRSLQTAAPKMNITECDKNYKLELSVPGLTKEDLKVNIDSDNNLVISVEKKTEENNDKDNQEEKHNKHYLRHEFSYCEFKQVLALPDDVCKEQISAKVENGILNVVLPKVAKDEQKKLTQTIEVC